MLISVYTITPVTRRSESTTLENKAFFIGGFAC